MLKLKYSLLNRLKHLFLFYNSDKIMNSDIIQAKIARLKEDLRDLEASSIMLLREAPVEKMREFPSIYERETADSKSVFVRGFPPQTTAGELAQFFMERVGTVERSTIMMSRLTGASLGYAYIILLTLFQLQDQL